METNVATNYYFLPVNPLNRLAEAALGAFEPRARLR